MHLALPLAAEPAFLAAAAVFVIFAVIVSVVGLTSDRFGASKGQERLVIGLGLLFMVGAMATAVITAESPAKEDVEPLHKPKNTGPPPAPAAPSTSASAGGAAAAPSGPATNTIKISADPSGQLAYQEKAAQAKAGKDTIDFTNKAPTPHDVVIAQGSTVLGKTPVITGKTAKASVTLKPGKYVFYCSVPGHRQAGMQGVLTVQ